MLKVSVIGATGYAGEELLKLLLAHKDVKITYIAAKVDEPKPISELCPSLKGRLEIVCGELDIDKAVSSSDLAFLSLPHRVSMKVAPSFIGAGKRVIDLSADYRLKDTDIYKEYYKTEHEDRQNLGISVYGLPELYRDKIKKAKLIANPGCYPTSVLLGLVPLVNSGIIDLDGIIADSKSGVTGAGRCPAPGLLFGEVNESLKAYRPGEHQHAPEMEQELSNIAKTPVRILFVPHLVPMNRGILSTLYVRLKKDLDTPGLIDIFRAYYKNEPFVRIYDEGRYPEVKDVAHTNYCDIGLKVKNGEKVAVIISAIDNLLKGASGQAVQNMNIMCGFDEREGLR